MKFEQLLIGLLIGGMLGFGLTRYFASDSIQTDTSVKKSNENASSASQWAWPDSLDALKAAPNNHKVVYEDGDIRVLAVLLDGKKSEPVHTHKWKSVMWIAKPITPCQINHYKILENGKLVKADSLRIDEMPVNVGQLIDPEGPTSITNLGSDNGIAYRVEFKKSFKL